MNRRLFLQTSVGLASWLAALWHCHILEHEEHDMMHALVIV
jgi:FtsP/CotA-like multicopper oxidase with cupredoxin domain